MKARAYAVIPALALGLGLGLMACQDASGPQNQARVQIRLTDAPADYIESAEIWVSAVYLQRRDTEGEGEPRVYLFRDAANPRHYDLMELRDGITADLTEPEDVEAGSYSQLRLVVDSAFVTLKEGMTFRDGSSTRSLKVPSGSSSGIKVQLAKPVEAESEETTIVLVDFDVNENFRLQGNPETPAGLQGILFTPVLKEKSRSVQ